MKVIEIYKSGKFYNVFGDDGIIIHELIGYKYLEYKKQVGFPESALNKVINVLESKKISYKVYGKSKEELLREFKGVDKRYKENLMNALKNYDMEKRLERLKNKINSLDIEQLEQIIGALENEYCEQ